MKGAWLCFGYVQTDDGRANEVLIKVKLDGPLEDRNVFNPVNDRKLVIGDYRKQLKRRVEKGNIHFYSKCNWDTMSREQLATTAKQMQADLVQFRDITEGNMVYLEQLEMAPLEDLLDGLRDGGRDWKLKQFVRYYKDKEWDLVIINQKGVMGSVDIIDDEVVEVDAPSWLDRWVLFDEARRVSYGNRSLNGSIDRNMVRNKYKHEAQVQKKETRKQRFQAQKQREGGFQKQDRYDYDERRATEERAEYDERERSPPRKQRRDWQDNNNGFSSRGRRY